MTDKKTDNMEVVVTTPTDLLTIAVNQGADLDKLEKLMDLQDRYEKNEARKAYVAAMTAFKANPPEILKQTTVSYTVGGRETKYNHASLDHVAEKINVALSEHGLFASWPQSQSENAITVSCRITHKGGHSEETSLTAAADLSGSKNAIQGLGSTISYLQRYTMLALTGLAAKGMDTDGTLPEKEVEPINQDQINEIEAFRKAGSADKKMFSTWLDNEYGVKAVDRLNTVQGDDVVKRLKAKAAYNSKKKAA